MELGGNITLVGFKEVDKAELVVVKKIVGSYARKLSDSIPGYENLSVMLKIVHKTEGSEKYELHAKAHVKGKAIVSEVVERNLFVGLDEVLQHIATLAIKEEELSKE